MFCVRHFAAIIRKRLEIAHFRPFLAESSMMEVNLEESEVKYGRYDEKWSLYREECAHHTPDWFPHAYHVPRSRLDLI